MMKWNDGRFTLRRRRHQKGAILMVVLIVMIALLGLGMTGLFLTSGSVQMNANINLRNQALAVAEAGIERARGILNSTGWPTVPPIPTMLAGTSNAADEIPSSTVSCEGQMRGAILVDRITPTCIGDPLPDGCILRDVAYPSIDRAGDLPAGVGTVARTTMGSYTVYIRQDQGDCRMGNYTCEFASVASGAGGAGGEGGAGGAGGEIGATTCTPPEGAPAPNGALVIRSEGTATDGRTRVVLEVTLSPSQGAAQARSTPLSALCASGVNGCDDNSSVQSGIVVNSNIEQTAPSSGGTSGGEGGATGTGGAESGTGGGTGPPGGSGGEVGTGGVTGTGGAGTGGAGTGGAIGTGGSTACQYNRCKIVATMGVTGAWNMKLVKTGGSPGYTITQTGNARFSQWLDEHASECTVQNIDITTTTITPAVLAPFKIIIVLDLYHTQADKDAWLPLWIAAKLAGQYSPDMPGTQRTLQQSEADAVLDWVRNGGGLMTTTGYKNTTDEPKNVNKFLRPHYITYTTSSSEIDLFMGANMVTAFSRSTPIASVLTAGISRLQVTRAMSIKGWSGSAEGNLPPASNYFSNFASRSGYAMGVALISSPRTASSGRIVAWGDEWITYDDVWTDTKQQANEFWNNVLTWLAGNCTP